MAPFDPYHIWLGIPPEDQPPSHYRILGIPELESDPDVIDAGAERQTVFLRTFQTGDQVELAEQLLNEVSAARVYLLDVEQKAEYDQQLQVEMQPAPTPALVQNDPLGIAALQTTPAVPPPSRPTQPIWKQFFAKRWFLVSLVVTLVIGTWQYEALTPIASLRPLRYAIVAIVLFLMALPLETRSILGSMKRPRAVLLPVAVTFGLLPLFALLVSQLLNRPMAEGLLVAAITPCTLASASVWTRRAGGNDMIAILVTVVTNLSCFIISPLWLIALLGEDADNIQIDFQDMVIKLAALVVLPMTLAQLVRIHLPLGSWATSRKKTLSSLAQCGILFMVFTGAVNIGRQIYSGQEDSLLAGDVALMIVAVLTVHIVMFWTGILLARAIRLSREDTIAVGFAGSQKTLMVGLQICLDAGVLILPMVAYHIGQLFVDTLFADYFAGQNVEPPDPAE